MYNIHVYMNNFQAHTAMILYFAFFNFAFGPAGNSTLPNFEFRNFIFRFGTLFGHERVPYSSKQYHIKTGLNSK